MGACWLVWATSTHQWHRNATWALSHSDFNTNLAVEVPVEGRFSFPDTGTWRLSVHHDWHNPIDGFLGSASLIPGRAKSLGTVMSQHAPVLCDVPCANPLADRIA